MAKIETENAISKEIPIWTKLFVDKKKLAKNAAKPKIPKIPPGKTNSNNIRIIPTANNNTALIVVKPAAKCPEKKNRNASKLIIPAMPIRGVNNSITSPKKPTVNNIGITIG
jgi:hypothetical protein